MSALTLPSQVSPKSIIKLSSSTTEPGSGSLVTPASTASKDTDSELAVYRYINSNTGTCILLQADAVVEVIVLNEREIRALIFFFRSTSYLII